MFIQVGSLLFSPYSQLSFEIEAINHLFTFRSIKDKEAISSWQKVSLMCCFSRNERQKKLLEKGVPMLEKELDLCTIIKKIQTVID